MRNKFLSRITAFLAFLAFGFSCASSLVKSPTFVRADSSLGDNVFVGGDFEGTDPLSYFDVGNAGSGCTVQSETARSGSALRFEGSSGNYLQHHAIALQSHSVYLFEYYAKVENAHNLTFSTFVTGGGIAWIDFATPILSSDSSDWVRIAALLSVPEYSTPTQAIHIGFKFYNSQMDNSSGSGVVYLDDISVRFLQSQSTIGANLGFEYQYDGMPINWTYSGSGEFLAQSDELPENPSGKYAAKISNATEGGASFVSSAIIPVSPNTSYEFSYDGKLEGDFSADSYAMFVQYEDKEGKTPAYSPSFNVNNSDNYYRSTGEEGDKGTEFINPTWNYHLYGESDWRKVSFSFITSPDAHYLQIRLIAVTGICTAYVDNISLTPSLLNAEVGNAPAWTNVDPNEDFERIDSNRKPWNWNMSSSMSYQTVLDSDDTFYHSGRRSLHLETDTSLEKTLVDSSARIEVIPGDIYEFKGYFASKNCDPRVKVRLCLKYYDEQGGHIYNEYGDKLYLWGETYVASSSSLRSNWAKMLTRSAIPTIAKYVSYYVEVLNGYAEIWLDDFSVTHVETTNLEDPKLEYSTDFSSQDSFGNVEDWKLNDTSKAMWTLGKEGAELFVVQGDGSAVTYRHNTFITNYQYRLRFTYNASTSGYLRIDFYDSNKKRRDGFSIERPLSQNSDPVDLSFVSPSATYAIISLGLNGAGTLHCNGLTIHQTAKPSSKGEWSGKWVWLNENATNNPEQYRYFRYTFELPSKATYAPLQLTVDDKYVFYVNGQFVDFNWEAGSDSWANVQKYFLQDYLVEGKNVFAFKCYNLVSEAGLLFDGRFTLEDGTEFLCASSKDVKVTLSAGEDVEIGSMAVPVWALLDFDDSGWANTKEYGSPPVSPWGPVYYDSSLYVDNKIRILGASAPRSVEAGDVLRFTLTIELESAIENNFVFSVGLVKSATGSDQKNVQKSNLSIVSENTEMTSWPVNTPFPVEFQMHVASLVDAGRYDLRLESNVVTLLNDDLADNRFLTLKVLESTKESEDLTSTVENYNGAPTLMINGKPYSPVMYLRPDLNVYRQTDAEDRIANCTYELYITYQGCLGKNGQDILYREDGTLDYEAFDDAILSLLNASGEGYAMVNFGMFAPNWWKRLHPEELVYSLDSNGNPFPDPNGDLSTFAHNTDVSFSSILWRETSSELLADLIEHMKGQKYYNRVYGIRITAGQTYEFMNVGDGPGRLPDFSPAALNRFREWAKEKYGTEEALQKAWKDDSVTFDSISIPTMGERMDSTYSTLYSMADDAWKVDYNLFLSQESGNALLHWAKVAKDCTGRTRIVGAYYGYLWTFGSYDGVSKYHGNLEKVLASPDIDFIASPINYDERVLGMSSTFMSALETIQSYGKLYLLEQDNRTFISDGYSGVSWDGSWDYSVGEQHTIEGTIYNFRRDFANNFINGAGFWHYDMYGAWLDDEQIYQMMATEKRIYDDSLEVEINYVNDVAVFVGDSTYSYVSADITYNSPYTLLNALFMEQRENLNRMGTGYDVYTLSSLTAGKVKPHKVNIFLSPLQISLEDQQSIHSYLDQIDNAYAVWVYAPGWSDGTGEVSAQTNISSITGFDLVVENRSAALQTQIVDTGSPLTKGLGGKRFGTHSVVKTISPLVYISENDDCERLGYFTDGGHASLGVKRSAKLTSIYSGAPALPVHLLRNILEEANVHRYSTNNNDLIYSNSAYIALHSAYGETKTITLKERCAVYDEFEQRYISLDCISFTYEHEAGDTKIFRLDPVGGIIPAPIVPDSPAQNKVNMGEFYGITTAIVGSLALFLLLKFLFRKWMHAYREKRRIP